MGGTPGGPEVLGGRPLDGLVINEFLAHTDDPQLDFIELFNTTNAELDLVGCVLTDSISTNRFLRWLLADAPGDKLQFMISLDASPGWNHIPRAGFDADRFVGNLDLVRYRGVPFGVLSVVSVLSVFDLANFLQWQDQNQIRGQFNHLYNPDCLDAALLPRWIRQTIWDQLPPNGQAEPVLREVLLSTKTPVDIKLIEQYNYLTQYFQRTQQDPTSFDNELFQAWWTWLEQNYRK